MFLNSISEKWEKDAFFKYIDDYNKHDDNYFLSKGIKPLIIDRMGERSIPDELEKSMSQNMLVVIISYVLMFLYIALIMGEFSLVGTKILLALGGILVVLLSCVCSFGIVCILDIKISFITFEVVPFLVLAIGVDNMFIISGTKARESKKYPNVSNAQLLAITMKEAGPSITVASLCEFLAFAVGYLTDIPALQSFCLTAAFAVGLDYILQITLFLSFASLDEDRTRAGRVDIFPCYKIKDLARTDTIKEDNRLNDDNNSDNNKDLLVVTSTDDGDISIPRERNISKMVRKGNPLVDKIINKYLGFILSKPSKIIFIVFYVIFVEFSILGLILLPIGLDQRVSVDQNSEIFKYFTSQLSLVDAGPPAYLVLSGFDFTNKKTIDFTRKVVGDLFCNVWPHSVYLLLLVL